MLYELQVHQIELEMQNEELRRSQMELDNARASYFELYEQAPVGYITVSEQGLVLKANLSAVTLLGLTRRDLIKKIFSSLIFKEDQDIWYLHRKQLLEINDLHAIDLRLAGKNETFV